MRRVLALLLAPLLIFAPLAATPRPVAAQVPTGELFFAGPFGIWRIAGDGKGEELLATGANADMPSFAPDGRRFVYVITAGPEIGAWIYDTTNNTRTQIANQPWRWPVWAPNGRFIAFTLPTFTGSDLFIYDIQSRAAAQITVGGVNEAPQWWLDSSRLLFSRNGELWQIRVDGGEAGPMRGVVGRPILQAAWSPDGVRLAFLTVEPNRSFTDPTAVTELWVGTNEGFDAQIIARGSIDRTQRLSWSPDGTRISYGFASGLGSDVYVVYQFGGTTFRLTDGANPVWRPATPPPPAPAVPAAPSAPGVPQPPVSPATPSIPGVTPAPPPSAPVAPGSGTPIACARAPERMYAAAINIRPQVVQRIGCPTGDIASVDGVMQQYEGGFLLWRNVINGTSVWVFFNDGTWAAGDTTWTGPAPFIPAPPPGRVLPRNAFFNVWRSIGGPTGRLGWAITEETGFASDSQAYERGIAFAGNNQVLFVNIDGTYERVPVQ